MSGWNIPNVDGVVAFPRKEEVKENKRGSCCSNDDEIRHYKQPCVVEDSRRVSEKKRTGTGCVVETNRIVVCLFCCLCSSDDVVEKSTKIE